MNEKFDFEKAMVRLNEIALELESEEVALDKAVSLFEEGLNLSQKCQNILESYEKRVQLLVKEHQGKAND